ncbi:Zinc finger in DBF-like protein [Desmophyllum pertusum]|uniref:Zinc finger in DBF-like protein n=1 Tax=Desmophyllum pertusum TaxID=174260 RepID=A0A9X0A292_9CNID|nr:Zinc finger in DBF-like protein [Desmophyllum pertusum]
MVGIEKKPASKPLVSGRVAKQGVKPKVRKLYAPFIKVEDHSRAYKPLVHELKEWPRIYFDGSLGSCPFDSPKKDLEHDREDHARTKRKTAQEDKNKKKGFCECCCVHYEDLDMHLHSDCHQSFARDSSNYQSLDDLIKKGPSLQDFLAEMLLKHQQKDKEIEKEKQAKNRSELPSSGNSIVDRDEEKRHQKQNRREELPNCQTPPDQTPTDQTPTENAECRTRTNPSPREGVPVTPPLPTPPQNKNQLMMIILQHEC